jgi:hypothetical protein
MLVWIATAAYADYYDRQESWVVGASVVFGLGKEQGVGFGLDASYQIQRYWERGRLINLQFTVWGDELLAPNYGPVLHLWRADQAWFVSAGARAGATWPLRVGVGGGWWPGPGLTGEVAAMMSTNGNVGLDLQAVVDAPWTQARLGIALGTGGWHTPRLALGVFTPLVQPHNWDTSDADIWDPDRTTVPPDDTPDVAYAR